MSLEETLCGIWLQHCLGYASVHLQALYDTYGDAAGIYAHRARIAETLPRLSKQRRGQFLQYSLAEAGRCLEAVHDLGASVVCYHDKDDYPPRLRELSAPPAVLYVWGKIPNLTDSMTVVGTRRADSRGTDEAERCGRMLARAGRVTVSGLAMGIDAAALRGAVEEGGKAVAVLGGGLDVACPALNRALCAEIRKRGAVISEYPPGAPALGRNFPVRNRILAALSDSTFVVQAGERSGAIITAGLAREMGHRVFVLTPDAADPRRSGLVQLAQDGAETVKNSRALFDTAAEDLPLPERPVQQIEEKAALPKQKPQQESPRGEISAVQPTEEVGALCSPDAQRVYACLNEENTPLELLADRLMMQTALLMACLTELEMLGLARMEPGPAARRLS